MRSPFRHRARRGSLSVRGQLFNTFAGLGAFVALMLLALGLYLIDQQFVNPLESTDAGLILAAVLLATSLAMFSAVVHPSRKQPRQPIAFWNQVDQPSSGRVGILKPVLKIRFEDSGFRPERYVDRTQIRLPGAPQARGMAGK